MAKAKKQYRWVCPECGKGALGPSRPRKDNIVRYCLPCSAKAGKLVARVCPALDNKRNKKAVAKKEAAVRKRARTSPKPRNTKLAFVREPRSIHRQGINMMLAAKKICGNKSAWNRAMLAAFEYRKIPVRSERRAEIGANAAEGLWKRTVVRKGRGSGNGGIVLMPNQRSGRGGPHWGATVGIGGTSYAALQTLLHEIVHVVHLSGMNAPRINGKRRPHGYCFNIVLCSMAKSLWGYPYNPYEAGYSVGRGYAPSRNLEAWLYHEMCKPDSRVNRWLKSCRS